MDGSALRCLKAWHSKQTGHTCFLPLSSAGCLVSQRACRWTPFLKEHEVYNFTAADFEQDCETLRQVRARGLNIESAPVRSSWRSKIPSG